MQQSAVHKLTNSTFTSQFFKSTIKTETEMYITAIKNNRSQALHALSPPIKDHFEGQKPLLHYAAFYNSPNCTLYLLHAGANCQEGDCQEKTVFHVCAYTGHVEMLKIIRNEMKLQKIKKLNQQFIEILTKSSYKRTDFRAGKLKFSVSEGKQKTFERIQEVITELYQKYLFETIENTFNLLIAPVKATRRNCIHLACLNRYQKCLNVLEYMFEELGNADLQLDQNTTQLYAEVDKSFAEKERTDPRLFYDTLALIEEIIQPCKLLQIKKEAAKRTQHYMGELMQSKDSSGHTPLYIASQNGYTAILNLIKKWEGSSPKKNQNKEELIQIASHNLARSHIMDLCEASKQADPTKMNFLLSCWEQLNKKKTIFGTFALLEAVKTFPKEKNLQPIRLLILSGADVNEQDTNGWTIFHHACDKGMREVLAEVFSIWEEGKCKKIAINKLTNKNYHMLHLAAMNNHPQTIQFLINSPAAKKLEININSVDGEKCTMLHHAARRGSLQAIKKILQFYPNLIYEQDLFKNTALHYAAISDHTPCIQYLLYFDSDFDRLQTIRNSKGKLAKDLTVTKKQFDNIFTATRSGDVNLVRKMLNEHPHLKTARTPAKDRTLLILAVINSHLLVVKYLVQAGAEVGHKDRNEKKAKDYALQIQKAPKNREQLVIATNMLTLLN